MTDAELKRDMSCREIEAQTGVSKATISRFLNNGHDISLSTARKLLPVLKDCPCCNRADLSPAAVTVKPLEWVHCKPPAEDIDNLFGEVCRAETPYDEPYIIYDDSLCDDDGYIDDESDTIWFYGNEFYPSVDAAKSAAQADYERRILSALTPAPEAGWRDMDVAILTMKLSGNREEHWVRITCDGRTFDVRKYDGDFLNRAEYERDTLRHVLLGEPKPNLMDDKYADPSPGTQPATEQQSVKEADLLDRMTNDHRPLSLYRECDEDGGSWVVVDNSRDTVVSSGSDAQEALEIAFPKRCKGGDIDAFNGDCLWCGAPMGGTCQDAALSSLAGDE